MPAAEQLRFMVAAFNSLDWWELRPAQELLVAQPSAAAAELVFAARNAAGSQAAIYAPQAFTLRLNLAPLQPGLRAAWVNPRDGERHDVGPLTGATAELTPPGEGDWLLLIGGAP